MKSSLISKLRCRASSTLIGTGLALTLVLPLFLSACTTSANSFLKETSQTELQNKLQNKLVSGVSTQTDVQRELGTQYREFLSDGELVWVYTYVHKNNLAGNLFPFASAVQVEDFVKRDLFIYFDSDKRVKNFKLRDHSQ